MKLSLLRNEDGVASWVYIGGGGLLILILGIVIFASPDNTQTDESVDEVVDNSISSPVTDDFEPLPRTSLITDDGSGDLGGPPNAWAGFGDVPVFDGPPVGNFEVVDQGFLPLDQVERGSTPHLIVATDGNPPVDTYLPIVFRGYEGDTGRQVWTNTLDGPSSLVCRGADGCSLDGPRLTEILLPDGSTLLVQAVSNDDRLLGQVAFGQPDPGSPLFDVVHNVDDVFSPVPFD